MKKILAFVCCLFVLQFVKAQENLITTTSFDKIKKNTTLADLKKLYGTKNVTEDIDYAPEGLDSFKVTIIYKGTKKEMMVGWAEKKRHKQVAYVQVYSKGSAYRTADGLKVGSTLDDLVKVNGKRISFSGFGWDYGGSIVSFGNGKLEKAKIFFDLDCDENIPDKLLGDTQLHTDMALVKKYSRKIYVRRMHLSF